MATATAPAVAAEAPVVAEEPKPAKKEGLFKKFCRNSFNKCDYDGLPPPPPLLVHLMHVIVILDETNSIV